MKYYLIMNPGSRGGKSQKYFELIFKLLEKNHIDYDYAITKSLEHAYDLSMQGNLSGYDVIVAVGGDGTINRVMNGFYNSDGTRNSNAALGVLYTGTSPDFCKSYHIPLEMEKAVHVLTKGYQKQIGVGRVEFKDGVKYFACCANIGLGATLAKNANNGIRKYLGDKLGTFVSLFKTLASYKPIDVELNGEKIHNVYNISIGKTFYIASGIKIKNDLKPNDERFYIFTVQGQILRHIWKVYKGCDLELDYQSVIDITGCGQVEFDGDPSGYLPCKITSAQPLNVICED